MMHSPCCWQDDYYFSRTIPTPPPPPSSSPSIRSYRLFHVMHVIPEWLFDHPINGIIRKSCRPSKVAALDLDYQLLHSWIYRGLQLCMPYKNVDACNPAPQEDVCKPIKFLQNNLLVNINRKSGYIICQQWSFAKDVRIFDTCTLDGYKNATLP